MRQVAPRARVLIAAGLAPLALVALLALSGRAAALGEAVEVHPEHVLEGQGFQANLTVPALGEPSGLQVKVTCPSCGAGWTSPALTGWRQVAPGQWRKNVDFPGPLFGGSQGEPRWAQNYTVALLGTGAAANATVHLIDDWRQPGGTYEVTGAVKFRVAGVPTGSSAYINISKWSRTGALGSVVNLRVAGVHGIAEYDWTIPKEHAADMTCPQAGKCRNYTATVTAAGRTERVQFQATPAALQAKVTYLLSDALDPPPVPLGPGTLTLNRTENLTVHVDLKYHNNARVGAAERTLQGNESLNGTLALALERITVAQQPDGTQSQALLERVALLWAKATPQGWRATWTLPRNLSLTQQGADNPQYRVRLLAQEDRWGNDVPDVNGTGFKVEPLRISPRAVGTPAGTVERLTNATAIYNIRYADGTPWTNRTNASAMRASLVDAEGDVIQTVALRHVGEGTWSLSFQPNLKFRPLGFYQLRLHANTDAADNVLLETDTEFFEVVPARPRVELVTKVGHETRTEAQGFARGDFITIAATIRYADGSPYNLSRLPPGDTYIPLNVTKVDERGEVRGHELLALEAADDDGRWASRYGLPDLDEAAPLGPWQWRVVVKDGERPPNLNDTSFLRPVRGAGLRVDVIRPPEPLVRAGDAVTMRYQVRYPAPNNTMVDERYAAGGLVAEVRPWKDGKAGEAVARVAPLWLAERGEWVAVWHTNRTTLVGEYVFVLLGQDAFGNLLRPFTTSPVDVFVDRLQRQVLREPAEQVRRGESVLVVFDGAEGDLGEEGAAAPRIEVQKWNPLRQAWEKERTDVRVPPPEAPGGSGGAAPDHVGRFDTDGATNLGTYRFALFARNDQHAVVHATSRAFKLLPLEVERAWMPTAQAQVEQPVPKGAKLTLALQREDGDQVQSVGLFRNGERLANATALLKPGRFEVQFSTVYALPDGAYQVVVRGRDLHNNSFASPPLTINVTGVDLQARVPAPPAAAIQRADRLELRALIQYPDQVHVKQGRFTAAFLLEGAEVAARDLELNRSAWLLSWTPPANAPLGEYRVVLRGDDGLGNAVEPEEVFSFQLAEGRLDRTFAFHRNIANRTENIVWVLPASGNDTAMRFVLRDDTGARRELAFNVSKSGDYVVAWRPAKDERLTRYTLEAHGADAAGNAILAESRSLLLRPAQIGVNFLEVPDPRTGVKPGIPGRWVFQLQYADGTPVPADSASIPRVAIAQASTLVQDLVPGLDPERSDRWVATWTPEAGKHRGVYSIVVAGQDALGNQIQFNSRNFKIDVGLAQELFNVPGPEAALLPLALAAAAWWARRRPPAGPGEPR